jgi:hypothetical protein
MREVLWRDGLPIIRKLTGLPDDKSRTLLGRLLKATHDDCAKVYRALRQAEDLNPADPIAWLRAACNDASRHQKPNRVADALAGIFGSTPPPDDEPILDLVPGEWRTDQ